MEGHPWMASDAEGSLVGRTVCAPTPTAIVEPIEVLCRRRWTCKQIAAEGAGSKSAVKPNTTRREWLALVLACLAGGVLGVARRLAEGFVGNDT
jgi:hypothetical protein